MYPEFHIIPDFADAPIHGSPEVAHTAARVRLQIDGQIATRAYLDFARSTSTEVLLSAYPLALWFVVNWWRLRWESSPPSDEQKTTSWRMAHELPAAGFGFLWPYLTFSSDGESIDIVCQATDLESQEPVRYLSTFQTAIPAIVFEQEIDSFARAVIDRLAEFQISTGDLKAVWQCLAEERSDLDSAYYRQLEARLGYDPDEAPARLVDRLLETSTKVGKGAMSELASAIAGNDPIQTFTNVLEASRATGIEGRIELPRQMAKQMNNLRREGLLPWERGRHLAHLVRESCGLTGDTVTTKQLADILHISPEVFEQGAPTSTPELPIGLSMRTNGADKLKFLFRRSNRDGRRFEASRFLADWLLEHERDGWYPTTDMRTARQKIQRAFAAEFLCPIDTLTGYLHNDFSDYATNSAARHFEVSQRAILTHLVNNRKMPRDAVTWQ